MHRSSRAADRLWRRRRGRRRWHSLLPIIPTAPVTLSGTATYESVPNPNGRLVYASTAVKPVRAAFVEVLDAASGSQLATTSTDDNGAYSASVPGNTNVIVRVRAR